MDTLVDTGYLVALFNDGDAHHESAVRKLGSLSGHRLCTVWEVMTEANHLLDDAGWLNLMRRAAAGRLAVLSSDANQLAAMADYTEQCLEPPGPGSARPAPHGGQANLGRPGVCLQDGGADLAAIALVFAADRLKAYNVLTVDRKDFDRYRTPSGKRLVRIWVED